MGKDCGFRWSTAGGTIGSNHSCVVEHDHEGHHRCHCGVVGALPMSLLHAREIAEQIYKGLGEFAEGLKMFASVPMSVEEFAASEHELRESAKQICECVNEFLGRIIEHGVR